MENKKTINEKLRYKKGIYDKATDDALLRFIQDNLDDPNISAIFDKKSKKITVRIDELIDILSKKLYSNK